MSITLPIPPLTPLVQSVTHRPLTLFRAEFGDRGEETQLGSVGESQTCNFLLSWRKIDQFRGNPWRYKYSTKNVDQFK